MKHRLLISFFLPISVTQLNQMNFLLIQWIQNSLKQMNNFHWVFFPSIYTQPISLAHSPPKKHLAAQTNCIKVILLLLFILPSFVFS